MNLTSEFNGDSYDTPENFPRSLWDTLTFHSRFAFYIRNFGVFMHCGSLCKKGMFTPQDQIDYSIRNIRIMESCGGRLHLRGLHNLGAVKEPAVLICNHMSLLETAVFYAFVRQYRDFCFVIKRQLLDVPYFGHIMRNLHCVAVDRVNPRDDFKVVMEEGTKRLREEGKSVVIFPQSTRSEIFNPEHFNSIGVKLAKHAGAPIIPCALKTDFLGNGKIVKDLGPIHPERPVWFEFGKPILSVKGTGKEEQAQIVEFIKTHLREWGGKIAGENA